MRASLGAGLRNERAAPQGKTEAKPRFLADCCLENAFSGNVFELVLFDARDSISEVFFFVLASYFNYFAFIDARMSSQYLLGAYAEAN